MNNDPQFARGEPHDQRVPIMLTADEYLFARDEAERRGMSISAYFRGLLKEDRRHVALGELSLQERYETTHIPAQDLHKIVDGAVRNAIAQYEKVSRG